LAFRYQCREYLLPALKNKEMTCTWQKSGSRMRKHVAQILGGVNGDVHIRLAVPDIDLGFHTGQIKASFLVDQDVVLGNALRSEAKTFTD
jgi:hypothetical protein